MRFCHCHFVFGQSSGLVRTDNGGTSQRLYRRKPANDCIFLRHAFDAEREHDRDESRQTFRNGSDTKAYRSHKHIKEWLFFQNPQKEYEDADSQSKYAEKFTGVIQLFLQRRIRRCFGGNQIGNLSQFGLHPGRGDDGRPASSDDNCSGENHIGFVRKGRRYIG